MKSLLLIAVVFSVSAKRLCIVLLPLLAVGCTGAGNWEAAQEAAAAYGSAYLANGGDSMRAGVGDHTYYPQQQMQTPTITRCHSLLNDGNFTCTTL